MSVEKGRVLVAAPTYAGKEYALDAWVAGFHALDYEPKYAYMVDNTAVSEAYFRRIEATGIQATHVVPWPDWDRTFRRCWELILQRAQALDCYWVLSMEADNVVAPEGLGIMVDLALAGNAHLVTHSYPQHKSAALASGADPEGFYYNELGCALISRSLLARALDEYDEYGQMVVAIWGSQRPLHGRLPEADPPLRGPASRRLRDGHPEPRPVRVSGADVPGGPDARGHRAPSCRRRSGRRSHDRHRRTRDPARGRPAARDAADPAAHRHRRRRLALRARRVHDGRYRRRAGHRRRRAGPAVRGRLGGCHLGEPHPRTPRRHGRAGGAGRVAARPGTRTAGHHPGAELRLRRQVLAHRPGAGDGPRRWSSGSRSTS